MENGNGHSILNTVTWPFRTFYNEWKQHLAYARILRNPKINDKTPAELYSRIKEAKSCKNTWAGMAYAMVAINAPYLAFTDGSPELLIGLVATFTPLLAHMHYTYAVHEQKLTEGLEVKLGVPKEN